MQIVLEIDDFSPRNSNLGLLEDLHEHYPNFKVSLFTVPWEIRFGEPTPITQEKFKPFCDALIKSKDWIEVCLHGLTHNKGEFEDISYDEAKKRVMVAEKMLINRGIPYAKVFKAPHWQLSEQGKKAVQDMGFSVVEDGYYNWNLKDDFPEDKKDEVIIGHGHVQLACQNGLEEVFPKLLRLPIDTEFLFLSEYLKAEKVDPQKLVFDPLKGEKNE